MLDEFTRVIDAARGAIEILKEFKTKNAELPENRRLEFLGSQNVVLLALGLIGTFPNSIEDYKVKHEISSDYRFHAVILICPRVKNAAIYMDTPSIV
jgi:hypothetical protein